MSLHRTHDGSCELTVQPTVSTLHIPASHTFIPFQQFSIPDVTSLRNPADDNNNKTAVPVVSVVAAVSGLCPTIPVVSMQQPAQLTQAVVAPTIIPTVVAPMTVQTGLTPTTTMTMTNTLNISSHLSVPTQPPQPLNSGGGSSSSQTTVINTNNVNPTVSLSSSTSSTAATASTGNKAISSSTTSTSTNTAQVNTSSNSASKSSANSSSKSTASSSNQSTSSAEPTDDLVKPVFKDGELVLEVECGQNKAILYLSKLCQGSKGPCINFQSSWLTPNEFQFVSGRETAKDWKRSIRHHGKSLKLLLAKGILNVHPTMCDCDGCRQGATLTRKGEKRRIPNGERKPRKPSSTPAQGGNEGHVTGGFRPLASSTMAAHHTSPGGAAVKPDVKLSAGAKHKTADITPQSHLKEASLIGPKTAISAAPLDNHATFRDSGQAKVSPAPASTPPSPPAAAAAVPANQSFTTTTTSSSPSSLPSVQPSSASTVVASRIAPFPAVSTVSVHHSPSTNSDHFIAAASLPTANNSFSVSRTGVVTGAECQDAEQTRPNSPESSSLPSPNGAPASSACDQEMGSVHVSCLKDNNWFPAENKDVDVASSDDDSSQDSEDESEDEGESDASSKASEMNDTHQEHLIALEIPNLSPPSDSNAITLEAEIVQEKPPVHASSPEECEQGRLEPENIGEPEGTDEVPAASDLAQKHTTSPAPAAAAATLATTRLAVSGLPGVSSQPLSLTSSTNVKSEHIWVPPTLSPSQHPPAPLSDSSTSSPPSMSSYDSFRKEVVQLTHSSSDKESGRKLVSEVVKKEADNSRQAVKVVKEFHSIEQHLTSNKRDCAERIRAEKEREDRQKHKLREERNRKDREREEKNRKERECERREEKEADRRRQEERRELARAQAETCMNKDRVSSTTPCMDPSRRPPGGVAEAAAFSDYMRVLAAGHGQPFVPSTASYMPSLFQVRHQDATHLLHPMSAYSHQFNAIPKDPILYQSASGYSNPAFGHMHPLLQRPQYSCQPSLLDYQRSLAAAAPYPWSAAYPYLFQDMTASSAAAAAAAAAVGVKRHSTEMETALELNAKRLRLEGRPAEYSSAWDYFAAAAAAASQQPRLPLGPSLPCGLESTSMDKTGDYLRKRYLEYGPQAAAYLSALPEYARPMYHCTCADHRDEDIRMWSVEDVCKFLNSLDGCSIYSDHFREQRVDGRILALLTTDHLVKTLGMKLGPAVLLAEAVAKKFQDMSKLSSCEACRSIAMSQPLHPQALPL